MTWGGKLREKKGFYRTAFQGGSQVIGSHFANAPNSRKTANADETRLKHRNKVGVQL
jgi:hypothetical protein